jgi:hypothetical protein
MSLRTFVEGQTNDTEKIITDKMTATASVADSYQADLNEAISDLITAASAWTNPTWLLPGAVDIGAMDIIADIDAKLQGRFDDLPGDIEDPPDDPQDPEYGTAPVPTPYTIPPVPTIHEFVVPDVPPMNYPTFSDVLPEFTDLVPTFSLDAETVAGSLHYDSCLVDTLVARLKADIENGGTGLDPEVETAIWQRDLEREEQALADAKDKLEDTFARKAFMLPSSVMAEQLSILDKEFMNKQLDRSREIAIKQAELEQKNISERLALAAEVEKTQMDIWERTQERYMSACVKVAELGFEHYKLYVMRYNALVEAYKARVEVYKSLIQGEALKMEAYKAEIEGLKAIAQLDEVMIKAYIGQIEGIKALIETYKAEVQAYVARIEGEKAKIDVYKAEVEAWGIKTKATIDIFLGKIEGDKGWTQAYTALRGSNIAEKGEYIKQNLGWIQQMLTETDQWLKIKGIEHTSKVEAQKAIMAAAASLFSSFYLSTSTQVHLQASTSAGESYQEQFTASSGQ